MAIPKSILLFPKRLELSYDYLVQQLGEPFVLKDICGRKGQNNYFIKDHKLFAKVAKQSKKRGELYIAQTYIENDCDYRVLILGGHIALVMRRARRNLKSHLNNTSKGGMATLVAASTLPQNMQSACVIAAKLMERQVAGVDIVQDKTSGVWYCLEVNAGPQLATGGFTIEKQAALAAYLEKLLTT